MSDATKSTCPICSKDFLLEKIEEHVNRCIFLNCSEDETTKRKRSPSPVFKMQKKQPANRKSPLKTSTSTFLEGSSKENNKSNKNTESSSSKQKDSKPNTNFAIPLAKQVAPKSLDDFYGQPKILGKDTILRSLLEKGEITNMVLWGPPGCGKTSLAGVVNEICKSNPKKLRYVALCAASCGVKDIQTTISIAKNEIKFGRKTILFLDEIHAFNKKQQDTLLLSVEKGEITLIGATTENPSFSINSALLSRCKVIVLDKLDTETMYCIVKNAALKFKVNILDGPLPEIPIDRANQQISIENAALKWLADISDGDARIALNNLQLILQNNDKGGVVTVENVKEHLKKSHMLYDRKGEEHYNLVSAMHKSIRGSDDNAALYWTTRMIVSGEDPRFIARRLVRAASEDIGNADPGALQLAVTTMEGCQLLGMPEADVLLAQCAIYLARAPKSREADTALSRAKSLINNHKGPQPSVPMHIRNAPTKLMKELGYGKLEEDGQAYFMPPELSNVNFFE